MNFEDKLDDLKFYKYYDTTEVHAELVDYIDKTDMTYWGVAVGLFNHLASYAAYHTTLGTRIDPQFRRTLDQINAIINDVMREVYNG